jgi:hypothetical protein
MERGGDPCGRPAGRISVMEAPLRATFEGIALGSMQKSLHELSLPDILAVAL